jgi:hypothetical protein
MNPITINPYVFGALVSIIIGMLGFLIGNYLTTSGNAQRRLFDAVGKLDNTVTRLDTTISGMEKLNNSFNDGCKERHVKIDKEISDLWDKLECKSK